MIRTSTLKLRQSVRAGRLVAVLGLCRQLYNAALQERRDAWQTAAALAKSYDGFVVEDREIQKLVTKEDSNRGLRRGIMDSAWRAFTAALACKAEEAGMPFVRVNPRGTSPRCSACGGTVRKTLRDRVHDCPACGLRLDRDLNAAINIHDLGWRSAAKAAEDPG